MIFVPLRLDRLDDLVYDRGDALSPVQGFLGLAQCFGRFRVGFTVRAVTPPPPLDLLNHSSRHSLRGGA